MVQNAAATNYAGNAGTGVQKSGYNGLFRPLESPYQQFPGGFLASGEISDGQSNTAAFAEILVGQGSEHRLRTNFYTQAALASPAELDMFADACRNGNYTVGPHDYYLRGRPWLDGNMSRTLYNHVLTPNMPSCFNGQFVQFGAYTAASNHARGVMVAFIDGHVDYVAETIDQGAWRAWGSRNGTE